MPEDSVNLPASEAPLPAPKSPIQEVAYLMFRLGWTCFGGPAAHIALLREETVTRRQWVDEQEFLDYLSLAGLVPGPTSTEVAIHLGYRRAGLAGLFAAGLCFTIPAIFLTTLIAAAYGAMQHLPAGLGMLLGLKPAVIAVVARAVMGLITPLQKRPWLLVLSGVAAAGYLLGAPVLPLLLGCGVVMLAGEWIPVRTGVIVPLPLVAAVVSSVADAERHVDAGSVFTYFFKLGATLIGSGYALLAFMRADLVDRFHWLTEAQLLDAVAAGQFTPGPVFSTAAFVGYLVGGPAGAIAGAAGIFLPAFFYVWITHPLARKLRRSPLASRFLDGVNAGSIGLIAGVLFQLAAAALTHIGAWLIFAGTTLLLARTRMNSAWVLLAAALIGWVTSRQ